mmetsp:Transcript_26229/g.43455  ORF Transcript_26229/g.43455 Transcript_26229/m.43455 type:complete len:85 (+) Transcript_26229:1606-1860(+)
MARDSISNHSDAVLLHGAQNMLPCMLVGLYHSLFLPHIQQTPVLMKLIQQQGNITTSLGQPCSSQVADAHAPNLSQKTTDRELL